MKIFAVLNLWFCNKTNVEFQMWHVRKVLPKSWTEYAMISSLSTFRDLVSARFWILSLFWIITRLHLTSFTRSIWSWNLVQKIIISEVMQETLPLSPDIYLNLKVTFKNITIFCNNSAHTNHRNRNFLSKGACVANWDFFGAPIFGRFGRSLKYNQNSSKIKIIKIHAKSGRI